MSILASGQLKVNNPPAGVDTVTGGSSSPLSPLSASTGACSLPAAPVLVGGGSSSSVLSPELLALMGPEDDRLRLETLGNKCADRARGSRKGRGRRYSPEARRKRRAAEFRQVLKDLAACGRSDVASLMRECGRLLVYECGGCEGRAARRVYTCKSRLCPYCLMARAERIARKLLAVVEAFRNPVVMVLTVRNGHDLGERDAHIRAAWKKLTRRVAFQRAFAGGVCFWEATHNDATGWHVHLHCLVDGYMVKQQLSDLWRECTGDSFIVDLSYIAPEGRRGAIVEACKYPCKLSSIVGRPELVREYLAHTKGRRLFWTFGSAYQLQQDLEAAEDEGEELENVASEACPHCGTIGELRPVFVGLVNVTWFVTECWRVRGGWYLDHAPPGYDVEV